MTEAEAKTKVCHRLLENKASFSQKGLYDCLGSNCMAWRWTKIANPNYKGNQMAMYPAPNPYSQEPMSISSTTEGYCGLAGQP